MRLSKKLRLSLDISSTERKCSHCNIIKPIEAFGKVYNKGKICYRFRCIYCTNNTWTATYKANNKEKHYAYLYMYIKANKTKNMWPSYIARLLKIPTNTLTLELIKLKRTQLKILRHVNNK